MSEPAHSQRSGKKQAYRPFGAGYVSDFEQFLNNFLDHHPNIAEDRQRGWYIWWDHRLDLADLDSLHRNEVPRKPYEYE